MNKLFIYQLTVMLSFIMFSNMIFSSAHAQSPSFGWQIVYDDLDDMVLRDPLNEEDFDAVDIEAITYHSDGNFLNFTIWLEGSENVGFDDNARFDDKTVVTSYSIHVNADSDSYTGYGAGTDFLYQLVFRNNQLDYLNLLQTLTSNNLKEILSGDELNIIKSGKFIEGSLDLNYIGNPQQYHFYVVAHERSSGLTVTDFSPFIEIPPPNFTMSINPSSVSLESYETKTLELRLTSDSSFDYKAVLPEFQENEFYSISRNDGEFYISNNEFFLPSDSFISIPIEITAKKVSNSTSDILPIQVQLLPTTRGNSGPTYDDNFMGVEVTSSTDQLKTKKLQMPLAITITPSPPILEQISRTINPLEGTINIFTAIAGVIGAGVIWIYKKTRNKQSKNEPEKNQK